MQVPVFFSVQVFINAEPGLIKVPLGTVSPASPAELTQSGAVGETVAAGNAEFVPAGVVRGFEVGTSNSFDIVQLGVGN